MIIIERGGNNTLQTTSGETVTLICSLEHLDDDDSLISFNWTRQDGATLPPGSHLNDSKDKREGHKNVTLLSFPPPSSLSSPFFALLSPSHFSPLPIPLLFPPLSGAFRYSSLTLSLVLFLWSSSSLSFSLPFYHLIKIPH